MTTIPFLPQIGGMETVVALLARELVKLGCEVKVATATPSVQKDSFLYEVIRRPGRLELLQLFRWADVYLQHGPSLKFGWPVFFGRKPAAIVHHIWMNESSGIPFFGKWLRRSLLKRCQNLAVSMTVGKSLPVPWEAVPNPYDDELFRLMPEIARDRDIIFLGRLEPLKGIGDLIAALVILKAKGCTPTVTIVGNGSMREELEIKVRTLGLSQPVHFAGCVPGEELVPLLNRHKIMVVPSRYEEPFGVVALEGIACGCAVIGSSGGGLPEAIGSCGVTFPNGDTQALAETIQKFMADPVGIQRCHAGAQAHLAGHHPVTVARRYLEILHRDCGRK